ncbi:unnamed protein product, partial [Aphanomyces euteiches]
MGPDPSPGGGGGSPPPNPPNPPSYPIPAPAPIPRDRSPDSRYADCKKFAPSLDSLEHRRFLEFFLRRFDELAVEYRLSEEQLLLAGSDAPIIIQGIIEGCGDSAISNLLRQRRPRPRSAKECIRLLTDCEFDIDCCPNGSRSATKASNSTSSLQTPARSPRQASKTADSSENVILQTIKDLKTELRADMLTLAGRNDAPYSTQSQLAALSTSVAPIAVTPNTPVPPRICMDADD